MEDYKFLFKVVLVGNAGVGKTCLVRKFTQGIFPPGQSATIGVDFMIKTVKVDKDKVKLQIWDTAVLLYDVSCQPTFDCINEWMGEIEQYANKKALRILVGNKVDKDDEREVPTHIGESFAAANGFHYFIETSAVNSTNVDMLFQEVATRLANEMRNSEGRYQGGAQGKNSRQVANGDELRLVDRAQQQIRQIQNNCCGGGRASEAQ